jgi:hypothetical protein
MAARPQGYIETGDGLWFPHKARYPMGRRGCSIFVALAGLLPSISLSLGGQVLSGASFLAGTVLLILLLGLMPEPYGMALTESCVRMERRNMYRRDSLEIPESAWIELWNYEESEEEEGMMSEQNDAPETTSWRVRAATVEGWSALVLAIGSWSCMLFPRVDTLVFSVKELIWDFFPVLPAAIGFGLAVAGIRHGVAKARVVSWMACCLLLPLLVILGYAAAQR